MSFICKSTIVTLSLLVVGFAGAAETFTGTQDFGNDGLPWIHSLSGFESSNSIITDPLPFTIASKKRYGGTFSPVSNDPQPAAVASGQPAVLAFSSGEPFSFPGNSSNSSSQRSAWSRFKWKSQRGWSFSGNDFAIASAKFSLPETTGDTYGDFSRPNVPPATVPAPGAIILAGIGTALVGFLRHRKTV